MSKQTKQLSWCSSYFTRKEEKSIYVGYCRFCNPNCDALKPGRYTRNPIRMEEHLKHFQKRLKLRTLVEASKEIDRLLKRPAARRSRSASLKKPMLSEAAEVSPQESSGTIKHYFDTTSKDEQEYLDILLTRAFATENIPSRFLRNPFFVQFLNKLKPSYKLPSQEYKYPKVLISAEFNRVQNSLINACNKADFFAISSDGWTDVRSNSIINVMVHTPRPFFKFHRCEQQLKPVDSLTESEFEESIFDEECVVFVCDFD